MSSILIVDDEDKYLELCKRFMPEHVFLPPARNYREAASRLGRHGDGVDLVLLDVHFDIPADDLLPYDKEAVLARDPKRGLERLRRGQGLHILDHLRRDYPDLPVIVMTSRDDLPLEADAERLNAEDYTYLLDDDYLDARALKLQVEGILARRRRPATEVDEPFYWGSTPSMLALRRRLSILARGRLPIILLGETGTGKTLLAREFIHARSRRTGPFVAVDLSTIPRDLMAAHLFGVVKGAYTGATATRDGVLARAHEGTLFLDEIGNLNLDVQKSLLTVLQDSRYHPVGSVEELQVDVKIVVATNEDLGVMVRDGRFREDLYMRLNPATALTLTSLRGRRDDFQELLRTFLNRVAADPYNRELLAQYAEQRGLRVPADGETMPITVGRNVPPKVDPRRIHLLIQPTSFGLLREFAWPGNFRQFEMLLSNLVALTLVELVDRAEQVEPDDPTQASRPDVVPIPARTVRELMRPMEPVKAAAPEVPQGVTEHDDGSHQLSVSLRAGDSLNAVSCAVERQYLEGLYEKYGGDLARIAEALLDDPGAGRKVQLRMNQLGIKLRRLKRRTQR